MRRKRKMSKRRRCIGGKRRRRRICTNTLDVRALVRVYMYTDD